MSPWNNQQASETLDNLRPGFQAAVLEVHASNRPACLRLQELGLVPGAPVEVLSSGDSILVRVGEQRLVLRRELAHEVSVLPAF